MIGWLTHLVHGCWNMLKPPASYLYMYIHTHLVCACTGARHSYINLCVHMFVNMFTYQMDAYMHTHLQHIQHSIMLQAWIGYSAYVSDKSAQFPRKSRPRYQGWDGAPWNWTPSYITRCIQGTGHGRSSEQSTCCEHPEEQRRNTTDTENYHFMVSACSLWWFMIV